jgi:hypothetical protein
VRTGPDRLPPPPPVPGSPFVPAGLVNRGVNRAAAALQRPGLPLFAALLAVALASPALFVGFQVDDFTHRLIMLRAPGVDVGPLSVFASVSGEARQNQELMDRGVFPWWTAPDLRFALCRPLSAASMWLDYRLWPSRPDLMHLHSLVWLALAVGAVAVLYRRILGTGWPAGLAGLLWAVDDAHATPATWIANRNALIATFFGVVALICHDRWRREGWRWGAAASTFFLALGLLSGEMALPTAAYLAAYALFLEKGPGRERLASLLPAGVTVAAYLVVYRLAGFGTHGSGLYVDPLDDPLGFARAFLARAPVLLLGQWSPIPADLAFLLPRQAVWMLYLVALGAVGLLAFLLAPLVKAQPVARFFALGMSLSLVPLVATFPSNRLLLFAGVGGMGLVAQFLAASRDGSEWSSASRLWRRLAPPFAVALVFVHLVLAAVMTPVTAYCGKLFGAPALRAAASLGDGVPPARQDLVLVNSPDYLLFVSNVPAMRSFEGKPSPFRVRGLVAGPVPVEVSRPDARALRLRLVGGLYEGLVSRLFRGDREPLRVGDVVSLPGMEARVNALTEDGQPEDVTFRFGVALEDPSLRFARWERDRYVRFAPPPVGQSVTLPAARIPLPAL